jgi:hypothetical protein
VTKLGDMDVPGWLLKIVIGFLTESTSCQLQKYNLMPQKYAWRWTQRNCPRNVFTFVLINDAWFANKNRNIGELITKAVSKRHTPQVCR